LSFYNTRELLPHIVLDKASLNHGNQVTVVLGHYKTHGTQAPAGGLDEVVVVASVIFVAGIKDHIGTAA